MHKIGCPGRDLKGRSALHWAATFGHLEAVEARQTTSTEGVDPTLFRPCWRKSQWRCRDPSYASNGNLQLPYNNYSKDTQSLNLSPASSIPPQGEVWIWWGSMPLSRQRLQIIGCHCTSQRRMAMFRWYRRKVGEQLALVLALVWLLIKTWLSLRTLLDPGSSEERGWCE